MLSVKVIIPDFIKKIQIDKPIKTTIFQIANDIRTDAVKNAPYKSGTLRRSLSVNLEDKGMTATIGSNLVYARIQEEGGEINGNPYLHFKIGNRWIKKRKVKIKGKRYLRNAYEKNVVNIQETFRKNFEKYIARLTRK